MATLYLLLSLLTKSSIFPLFPKYPFKIMGQLCFFIAVCSVFEFYNRVFRGFVGFFIVNFGYVLRVFLVGYDGFGCGFLFLGCFVKAFDVFVFLFVFVLGFKVLRFGGGVGFSRFRGRKVSKIDENVNLACGYEKECDFIDANEGENGEFGDVDKVFDVMSLRKMVKFCGGVKFSCFGARKVSKIDENVGLVCGYEKESDLIDENGGENDEFDDVDKVFDVMSLRKMVKSERVRANAARNELEKERNASASAASEAMAMILRLQNEKSSLQMQVNQLERHLEEKYLYDHDVIESLKLIAMKHEYEKCLLEDELRVCREKLKVFTNDEEWDRFEGNASSSSSYDGGGNGNDLT